VATAPVSAVAAAPPESPRPEAVAERVRLQADRVIAALDEVISDQLDAILQHSKFRRLEAAWRGLEYLVEAADRAAGVKIRALHVTWHEIARDLERAAEFDQSNLFQKIYEDEFGMPGGEPYGLLIGDYEVSHRGSARPPVDSVAVLSGMAQIAAAAFAPFMVGAAPDLLGMESFAELATGIVGRSRAPASSGEVLTLSQPSYQTNFARLPEYTRWRALRLRGDARFLGIILPHCLSREPHPDLARRPQPFRGTASRDAPGPGEFLWMSAVFAFASAIIGAYGRSGWFTDLRGGRRGEGGGGLVEGLPLAAFTTDAPGVAVRAPLEVETDYMQERALDELGLIPLMRAYATPETLFFANTSLHQPQHFDNAKARANARLSAMLQYILCVSRFAHYIKVLGRDRIGAAQTPEQYQAALQRWIFQYCTSDDEASAAMLARYPLREALIEVRERPGQPGVYTCSAWLKPHFQLDQIVSAYEIVTELAPLGAG
jgi:type VI secretion system protein ImpD